MVHAPLAETKEKHNDNTNHNKTYLSLSGLVVGKTLLFSNRGSSSGRRSSGAKAAAAAAAAAAAGAGCAGEGSTCCCACLAKFRAGSISPPLSPLGRPRLKALVKERGTEGQFEGARGRRERDKKNNKHDERQIFFDMNVCVCVCFLH